MGSTVKTAYRLHVLSGAPSCQRTEMGCCRDLWSDPHPPPFNLSAPPLNLLCWCLDPSLFSFLCKLIAHPQTRGTFPNAGLQHLSKGSASITATSKPSLELSSGKEIWGRLFSRKKRGKEITRWVGERQLSHCNSDFSGAKEPTVPSPAGPWLLLNSRIVLWGTDSALKTGAPSISWFYRLWTK